MPGTLTFKTDDIEKLVLHARTCKNWSMGYGKTTPAPGLFLVKDDGVYLMSNGRPHLPRPGEKEHSLVAYAKGCDPRVGDCYEESRRIMGGDDGADCLPLYSFLKVVKSGRKTFRIKVTKTGLSIQY